jgi:hypothetical protein
MLIKKLNLTDENTKIKFKLTDAYYFIYMNYLEFKNIIFKGDHI